MGIVAAPHRYRGTLPWKCHLFAHGSGDTMYTAARIDRLPSFWSTLCGTCGERVMKGSKRMWRDNRAQQLGRMHVATWYARVAFCTADDHARCSISRNHSISAQEAALIRALRGALEPIS